MTAHRPIYQQPHHAAAEEAVPRRLRGVLQADLEATGTLAPVDYICRRGGALCGLVEVKVRSSEMRAYATLTISLAKLAMMQSLEALLQVPVVLVVQWTDALGWARLSDISDVTMGGRADRGDPRDREMVAHIPTAKFRIIA